MFAPFLQKHAAKSPTLLRAVSWALNGKAMRKCPSCKERLSWLEVVSISRITPIKCRCCDKEITLVHPKQAVIGFASLLPLLLYMVISYNFIGESPGLLGMLALGALGAISYFNMVPLRCK